MKNKSIRQALTATTPTLLAYGPLGMVFGVLFANAGFEWYLAPAMSALLYAGAVQFVALSMMTEHASLFAILFAGLFIALRNAFYGLSVIERFKPVKGVKRLFLIFGLVDAVYAIFSTWPKQENDVDFCFYTTLFPYISWVLGTFVGALLSDMVPHIQGLDFILTSFFMVLVIEYYLRDKQVDALFVPIIASYIAYLLLPQYALFVAILACSIYIYLKVRFTA